MSMSPWVIVLCAAGAGCDAGTPPASKAEGSATKKRVSLNPPPTHAPDSFLDGPPPRDKFTTAEMPTDAVIDHELGGTYERPELNKAVATTKSAHVTWWTRYYDDIELELGAKTVIFSDRYETDFTAEMSGPERAQRDKMIGETKALELAVADKPMKATLMYHAALVRRRILGRDGTNAMDYVSTIDCWQLVYKVDGHAGGALLDAYTGEQLRHWSNRQN